MTETSPNLRVAAIELDIVHGNPKVNTARAVELISLLPGSFDIVVLPELFSTGFIADRRAMVDIAQPDDGPALTALREVSQEYGVLICGSFDAIDRDGNIYNRGFMLNPDGPDAYYDKRHLFSVSAEARIFRHGDSPMPIVDFRGWNVSMIVCYDLRFPVWSRNVKHRYDMVLVPANWPKSRGYAWEHLLIARAIENQAVVVGANRGGEDRFGIYDGMSNIFDGLGMPVGKWIPGSPSIEATLSAADLITARRNLPAHFDADDFAIL